MFDLPDYPRVLLPLGVPRLLRVLRVLPGGFPRGYFRYIFFYKLEIFSSWTPADLEIGYSVVLECCIT